MTCARPSEFSDEGSMMLPLHSRSHILTSLADKRSASSRVLERLKRPTGDTEIGGHYYDPVEDLSP
jgi:hypothetical protein